MYELHCPNCGWSAMLSDEQIGAALAEADRLQASHHVEHCPRCQWVMRVPVDSLRAAAPASSTGGSGPTGRCCLQAKAAKKSVAKKPAAKKAACEEASGQETCGEETCR